MAPPVTVISADVVITVVGPNFRAFRSSATGSRSRRLSRSAAGPARRPRSPRQRLGPVERPCPLAPPGGRVPGRAPKGVFEFAMGPGAVQSGQFSA